MQIRDAAAPRRLSVVMNASPQQWPPGANDLRDRALQVVAANPVDPLKHPKEPVTRGGDVRRRDADDRPPGHHEHHGEIGEPRNSTARDPLDASMGSAIGGRDRKDRSNLLVHGATSLGSDIHVCTCKRYARRLLICRPQRPNRPVHKQRHGCVGRSRASRRS